MADKLAHQILEVLFNQNIKFEETKDKNSDVARYKHYIYIASELEVKKEELPKFRSKCIYLKELGYLVDVVPQKPNYEFKITDSGIVAFNDRILLRKWYDFRYWPINGKLSFGLLVLTALSIIVGQLNHCSTQNRLNQYEHSKFDTLFHLSEDLILKHQNLILQYQQFLIESVPIHKADSAITKTAKDTLSIKQQ